METLPMARALVFTFILGIENYMLPCFTKKFLGLDCPGCGLQRSVLHLVKGEFGAAFSMYPAIYPILLLMGFLMLDQVYTIKYSNGITSALMIISVGSILINYILKFI
ncbi:DUF2752 domain-containing protein [Maribacter sp. 2307ULW6-5]|uniref:DUF2752 domain-containing protein n=1 Tax=Maribacter sp. 2307ULW6-5 TaxID=3386275 RepID=UPI0039BCF571